MDSKKNLFEFIDYGKIVFNIKAIADKKKLTVNQIVKRTGLHHQVVTRYYKGIITRYDGDVLARLCCILECELNDIMYYKSKSK